MSAAQPSLLDTPSAWPEWNPRYVLYARAHGRTPGEQRAHDIATWPNAKNVPFLLWMSQMEQAWRKARGYPASVMTPVFTSTERCADFDQFLASEAR